MTVAVSWAIPLDIAGDFAGSAAAIMNMTGNIGGALSPTVLAYLVKYYGWNIPFLVAAGLSVIGAAIYMKIDASKRIASPCPASRLSPRTSWHCAPMLLCGEVGMMKQRKIWILLTFLLALMACNRDPKVQAQRFLENGNKFFAREKYKEAAIMYRKALQKDLRYGEAYYRIGLTDLKLQSYSEAAKALLRAVELQPNNADAATKLADLYLVAATQGGPQQASLIERSERAARTDARCKIPSRLTGTGLWDNSRCCVATRRRLLMNSKSRIAFSRISLTSCSLIFRR